jgi:translation elongation factor P/translation initiation factor 5A
MSGRRRKRVRAQFQPEEDGQLRALVAELGTANWEEIAKRMPDRNTRQVRERWKHYLSSSGAKLPWSRAEDELLYEKVCSIGAKWTKISAFLPGRTDLEAKSRWTKVFSGKVRSSRFKALNRVDVVEEPHPPVEQEEVESPADTIIDESSYDFLECDFEEEIEAFFKFSKDPCETWTCSDQNPEFGGFGLL